MVDLSDGALWTKIFEQQYTAQPILGEPNKFKAIPLILLPYTFDVHSVAIECLVDNAKPTWRHGGEITQAIRASDASDIGYFTVSKNYELRINDTTLIQFDKYSIYFRIILSVPKWFSSVLIKVWVFTGIEPVNSIQEQLDTIKTQLNRIEQNINTQIGQ
jgi:hypothetical protein